MLEDNEIREANRVLAHLEQLQKTYKKEKHKRARDLLLHQALAGDRDCLEVVNRFSSDGEVMERFKVEATSLLQGHVNRSTYNVCLGLLAAHLMFW